MCEEGLHIEAKRRGLPFNIAEQTLPHAQAVADGASSTAAKVASSVADVAGTLTQAVSSIGKVGASNVVIKDLAKETARSLLRQ